MCLQHMCIKFEFENGSICLWGYDYDYNYNYDVDNGDDDDIETRRIERAWKDQAKNARAYIEHEHIRNSQLAQWVGFGV